MHACVQLSSQDHMHLSHLFLEMESFLCLLCRCSGFSEASRSASRADMSVRETDRLSSETPEQHRIRLQDMSAREADRLASEKPEQRQSRQRKDSISKKR